MEPYATKARELLSSGAVKVVIGYGEGSGGRVRALFVRRPQDADSLLYDKRCRQNLVVYLVRKETRSLGRPAIFVTPAGVRSILQLASENQLTAEQLLAIGINSSGELLELPSFELMEAFVAANPLELTAEEQAEVRRVASMTAAERWQYWLGELSECIKCYACRQACPMCYCARCLMDCNQPQWIPVASHALGNLEWHITRAMHLAGRCVDCGECARACPLGIPLNVLTRKLNEVVQREFGLQSGLSAKAEFALSAFKPDDKEHFIK